MPINCDSHIRVLLAEDNPSNQKVTIHMLQHLGYAVDAADNGLEALKSIKNQMYDLVLMNIGLPLMNGFEVTQEIRRLHPALKQPKIIALTAYAIPNCRERCLDAGMDDYIAKPIRVDDLRAVLRSLT